MLEPSLSEAGLYQIEPCLLASIPSLMCSIKPHYLWALGPALSASGLMGIKSIRAMGEEGGRNGLLLMQKTISVPFPFPAGQRHLLALTFSSHRSYRAPQIREWENVDSTAFPRGLRSGAPVLWDSQTCSRALMDPEEQIVYRGLRGAAGMAV